MRSIIFSAIAIGVVFVCIKSSFVQVSQVPETSGQEMSEKTTEKTIEKTPEKTAEISIQKNVDSFKENLLTPANIDVKLILEQSPQDTSQIFDRSQKLVRVISLCLRHPDLCLQTRTADLNRALETIYAIVDANPSYLRQLNKDALLDVIQISNGNAPILATQILFLNGMSDGEVRTALENSKNLTGRTKALVFDLLSSSANTKKEFLYSLYSTLSDRNDSFTSYEVQKKLADYNLTTDEFKKAIRLSCHLRTAGKDMGEEMWPVIKKNLDFQIAKADLNIDTNHMCD